jgi:hypothetical protein
MSAAAALALCGMAGGCRSGVDWSRPQSLSAAAGVFSATDHRIVALRGGTGGRVHALFLDDANADLTPDRLLYAEYDGTSWRGFVPLHRGPGRCDAAQLAVDDEGGVHVIWYVAGDAAAPDRLSQIVQRDLANGMWSFQRTIYRAPDQRDLLPMAAVAAVGREIHLVHANGTRSMLHRVQLTGAWTTRAEISLSEGRSPVLVAAPDGRLR